jgi:bifunctional non-homologous end joining protein LigD
MKRFNDLSSSVAKELKVRDAILDGEIVALDGAGRPAFYDLMKRRCQAVYYAFDIIWLNGRDLRELSLLERKKIYGRLAPCSLRQLQLRIFGGTSSIVDGRADLGEE